MKTIYILLFTLLFAAGCDEKLSDTLPTNVPIRLSSKYSNNVESSDITDEIKSLMIAVCQNNKIVWLERFSGQTLDQPYVKSEFAYQGTIYIIANETRVVNISDIVVGANETVFDGLYTSHLQNLGDADVLAMIGSSDLVPKLEGEVLAVKLKRNMARFDVVAKHKLITPLSIVAIGLPQDGRLTQNTLGAIPSDKYDINSTFVDPVAGGTIEGALFCHPFSKTDGFTPKIEISALYGDTPVKCYLEPTKAEPNTFYRIILREADGYIEADLVADTDMEFGDDTTIFPNEEGLNIQIDAANSSSDPSVVISPDDYRVTFAPNGGTATLALIGSDKKEFKGMEGSSNHLTVSPQENKFILTVTSNNRNQDVHESVILKFARVGETDPDKYGGITVIMKSNISFSTVKMAGVEWMTVNAQGPHPGVYPPANSDIRTYFAADWNKWSGLGEQWGPRAGFKGNILRFAAWQYAPYDFLHPPVIQSINGDILGGGTTTTWDNHALCPVGWRLPTREEFARIWPSNGTRIDINTSPLSYTTSAGSFTIALEKIGNNNLVISDGVNELIFPLAGIRAPNGIHDTGAGQTAFDWYGRNTGQSVYYWCHDRPANSNAYIFGYEFQNTNQYNRDPYLTRHNAGMDASTWANSRCVRIIQK